ADDVNVDGLARRIFDGKEHAGGPEKYAQTQHQQQRDKSDFEAWIRRWRIAAIDIRSPTVLDRKIDHRAENADDEQQRDPDHRKEDRVRLPGNGRSLTR